jgi:DNA-binding CsgD family transcriptional regulator
VDNGADFIRDALRDLHARTTPPWQVPARSTINRVLHRHGLLEPSPAKRPRSSWRRFSFAQPRDCYQIDATEVTLAGGSTVVVFDVLDDCTRSLVACHAAPSETADAAVTAIATAARPTASGRELDVLRAARTGASVAEIAAAVHLAPGTVRTYLSATMTKPGATTRYAAARTAWDQGWI